MVYRTTSVFAGFGVDLDVADVRAVSTTSRFEVDAAR